jgi:NAD(P)-dependent dehydrogenase (short-subunit alcohol dehydrogenase family)
MPELGAQRLFSLDGKIALVTGGGTGIGKMIAATYIRNGAKVYIASRKLADLEKVATQLSKLAPSDPEGKKGLCVALQADVGSKAGCDALAEQVKKAESRLDILVNNSGLTWGAPMVDFPEQKGWDKVFDLNVKSQFYLTVALLPLLENGKSNTVLNIASTAAIVPLAEGGLSAPGNGTYSCRLISAPNQQCSFAGGSTDSALLSALLVLVPRQTNPRRRRRSTSPRCSPTRSPKSSSWSTPSAPVSSLRA